MPDPALLIDHGAIETRATLIRDGAPVRFWFGPAPGAESADKRPIAGRKFSGRVRRVENNLSAAFVDIGGELDAFLPLRESAVAEGAAICVRVVAAPRGRKGAVVDLIEPLGDLPLPGRLDPSPAPVEAFETLGDGVGEIVTNSAVVAQLLDAPEVRAPISIAEGGADLFDAYAVDDALETALDERVALPGGGALHFSETEALAAIDVDTGGTGASSADRLREKVIEEAAREAALQIERRNLSGRIIIDFPSVRSRAHRNRAVKHIERALTSLSRVTSKSIAGSNLVTMTRERRGASLWDEVTEPFPTTPVAGRRYTCAWLSRRAVRAAEQRQCAKPSARLELCVGADLDAWLNTVADVREAYFNRWGVRLNLVCNKSMGARDFDLFER